MPSGFVQDTNQLSPGFYRVIIDMSNAAFYPTSDPGPGTFNDGGITPNSADSFSAFPTTLELAKSRARGNIRFRNILNQLGSISDYQVLDIEIIEADADTQAAKIAFTVKYDRPSFITLTGEYKGTTAVGNDIGGNVMNSLDKAIKNAVAQGIRDHTISMARVFASSEPIELQLSIEVTHTAASAAQTLSTITVTLLDGTELVSTDTDEAV